MQNLGEVVFDSNINMYFNWNKNLLYKHEPLIDAVSLGVSRIKLRLGRHN